MAESNHEVKTLSKAQEWFSGATEDHLPITVSQHKAANGRIMLAVYDKDKNKIFSKG